MNKTELMLMAVRLTDLYDEGVLSISPLGASKRTPSVHLTAKAFRELMGTGYYIDEWDSGTKEVSFFEGGVKFFTLVSEMDEIWESENEEVFDS